MALRCSFKSRISSAIEVAASIGGDPDAYSLSNGLRPVIMKEVRVVLISTYDLGRQPFGLASPAAWLRAAGHEVTMADVSCVPMPRVAVEQADLIAFFLPMHTATKLSLRLMDRVKQVNPRAHLCAYGLYAPLNERLLRGAGVS